MVDTYYTGFDTTVVSNIIYATIQENLRHQSYQKTKVNLWSAHIVETIIETLSKMNRQYKYIASCVVMEKNGAGLHTANSCFWDNITDQSCTVR